MPFLSGRRGEDANPCSIRKTFRGIFEHREENVRKVYGLRRRSKPGLYPDFWMLFSFGPPGIEPGPYEPESHVLPVYYGPNENSICES